MSTRVNHSRYIKCVGEIKRKRSFALNKNFSKLLDEGNSSELWSNQTVYAQRALICVSRFALHFL